jgi:hypothetical protein
LGEEVSRNKRCPQSIIAAVSRYLRAQQIDLRPSAKTREIFAAIYAFKGTPPAPYFKKPAKQFVLEFAKEIGVYTEQFKISHPKAKDRIRAQEGPRGFYWSDEWRAVRYVALRRSRGVCELCGTPPSVGKPLHVDHIKPRSKYPELELDASNLQVLCADCNLGKSNRDEIDWRRSPGGPSGATPQPDAAA